jgi:arginine-tRNA-protein transferase
MATTRAFLVREFSGEVYHDFMDAGFRRSGHVVYQPVCTGCRRCLPLRVPVAGFRPDKSQRRRWRGNADLSVTVDAPAATDEKFDLYRKYVRHWHGSTKDEAREDFEAFLYDSPVRTIEFNYRDNAGRLLAVGICDVCSRSLSSVYFYFDPDDAHRGLGTYGALYEVEYAKRLGIPYYYLGYWVRGCGQMEYKANFRPHEVLWPDGVWRSGDDDVAAAGEECPPDRM